MPGLLIHSLENPKAIVGPQTEFPTRSELNGSLKWFSVSGGRFWFMEQLYLDLVANQRMILPWIARVLRESTNEQGFRRRLADLNCHSRAL